MLSRDCDQIVTGDNYRSGMFGLALSGICFTFAIFLYLTKKIKSKNRIRSSIYDEPIIDNEMKFNRNAVKQI